jgi:hypothetical protein
MAASPTPTVVDRLPFKANHAVLAVAGGTINTASVGNRASPSRCSVVSRPTCSFTSGMKTATSRRRAG